MGAAYSDFGVYSLPIQQEPSQHRRSRVCLRSLNCSASAELQHVAQFVCTKMHAACEVTIFWSRRSGLPCVQCLAIVVCQAVPTCFHLFSPFRLHESTDGVANS